RLYLEGSAGALSPPGDAPGVAWCSRGGRAPRGAPRHPSRGDVRARGFPVRTRGDAAAPASDAAPMTESPRKERIMADPKKMFEGLAVALVTPFRGGALDRDALVRLTSHLAQSGVRALYPCGCTGEATSLTREERTQVIRAVVESAKGAAVIAG